MEDCKFWLGTNSFSTGQQTLAATDCHLFDAHGGVYYSDFVAIYMTAGEGVEVTMASTHLPTYLGIFDPDGHWLAMDHARRGTSLSRLQFTAAATGYVYIWLMPSIPMDTGSFTLAVSPLGGPGIFSPSQGEGPGSIQRAAPCFSPIGGSRLGFPVVPPRGEAPGEISPW